MFLAKLIVASHETGVQHKILCFLPEGTTGNSWWGCAARFSELADPISDQKMSLPTPVFRPGARFSKVLIINRPGKLSPFTLKIEVSIVLHLTR